MRTLLAIIVLVPLLASGQMQFTIASSQSGFTPIASADEPTTLVAFFNPTATNVSQRILCTDGPTNLDRFQIWVDSAATISATTSETSGIDSAFIIDNDSDIKPNEWRHLVGVFAASNSRWVVLDGTLSATNTGGGNPGTMNRISIGTGRSNGSNAQYFGGGIARPTVYNSTLSSAEILQLAKGFSPLKIRPTALVCYTRLRMNGVNQYNYVGANVTLVNGPTLSTTQPRMYGP